MAEPRATNGSVWVTLEPPSEEQKYDHYGSIAGVFATWDALVRENPECKWAHIEDRLFYCGDHCRRTVEEYWVFA